MDRQIDGRTLLQADGNECQYGHGRMLRINDFSTRGPAGRLVGKMVLWALLGIACGYRFFGIEHGLPFVYDPDEPWFVAIAVNMVQTGDLNPHWFGHPASVLIYICAIYYKVLSWWGLQQGELLSLTDFYAWHLKHPTAFYIGARAISAMAGVATVYMVYKLAQRLYGSRAAWIAAAVLAVNPFHIYYSQLVRSDVIASLFVTMVAWQALRIYETRALRSYILAGIFLALAVATKYPAALGVVMILHAHMKTRHEAVHEFGRLVLSGVAFFVALFLCSPYLFLDVAEVMESVARENRSANLSANGLGFWGNLFWYLKDVLPEKFGLLSMVLASGWALIGLIWGARKNRFEHAIIVLFLGVFLVFISSLNLKWARWGIPVIPFLAVLAGGGADKLIERLSSWNISVTNVIAVPAVVLALILPLGLQSAGQALARKYDTRTQAREWILSNIPRNSKIMVEAYGPQLPYAYYKQYIAHNQKLGLEKRRPHLLTIPGTQYGRSANLDLLRQAGIEYVILTNTQRRFAFESSLYSEELARYEELLAHSKIIQQFTPPCRESEKDPALSEGIGGPEIRILHLEPYASESSRGGLRGPAPPEAVHGLQLC